MAGTKERILQTALRLFAAKGYEAVSVSDIAGELGITKGALYKHYQNKRDIFDSILARMERRDAEQAREHRLPEGTAGETPEEYLAADVDRVVSFSKAMLRYWTQDEFAAYFRRLLTLEQFRSPEMGALYQQYLASGPLQYVTDLLCGLGIPRPREAAAELYGPMFLFYSVYDGTEEKDAALRLADACLDGVGKRLNSIRKEGKA